MSQLVLVTGATGYTGSNLVRKLVQRNYRVRVIARASSDLTTLNESDIEPVFIDLARDKISPEALKGVDIVYHLAAIYRQEWVPNRYFFDVHVGGTQKLLEAALRAGVNRFVHCSTVGVQGDIKHPPAKEEDPYNPDDEYQRSKMEGELLALSFFKQHSLPGVVVRPTGIYGPGDMRFLKLFRGINRGLFWMIGDGDVLYHFTYIEDLTDGMILAGEREEAIGQIFTIGGREYIKVKRLVEILAEILQRRTPERSIPVWPVMLAARVTQKVCRSVRIEPPLYPRRLDFFTKSRAFDISKAERLLGYSPKTDLLTGLTCTAAWYRERHYL